MDFSEKPFPKVYVAYVSHIGKYEDSGDAWVKMFTWLGTNNIKPGMRFGINHDDPKEVKDCRYDACVVISEGVEGTGDIKTKYMEHPKCAVLTHKGPYSNLGGSYESLFAKYGASCIGQPFEVYVTDMTTTAPDDMLTDLYLPIKKN
eukprot:Platyproteum_vivax@DN1700_c0_g1_i1.p1